MIPYNPAIPVAIAIVTIEQLMIDNPVEVDEAIDLVFGDSGPLTLKPVIYELITQWPECRDWAHGIIQAMSEESEIRATIS